MRQLLLGLGVSAVFVAGCVAGASSWGVSKAKAAGESSGERWAYFCFDASSTDDLHEKANQAGERGWQMVSGAASPGGGMVWCFKRARP